MTKIFKEIKRKSVIENQLDAYKGKLNKEEIKLLKNKMAMELTPLIDF